MYDNIEENPYKHKKKMEFLEAGFALLDLYEDTNGEGRLHELNIPTFLAMRSRK